MLCLVITISPRTHYDVRGRERIAHRRRSPPIADDGDDDSVPNGVARCTRSPKKLMEFLSHTPERRAMIQFSEKSWVRVRIGVGARARARIDRATDLRSAKIVRFQWISSHSHSVTVHGPPSRLADASTAASPTSAVASASSSRTALSHHQLMFQCWYIIHEHTQRV